MEDITPDLAVCSGAQSPAPGKSISHLILEDSIMSPGLQILALALTSWEATAEEAGKQPLWLNLTGARSQASVSNIILCMYMF